MQQRTSDFPSKVKGSENPRITRVPVGVHRTEIWEGVAREDPGICPLESIWGKPRPQTQVPRLRNSSCKPPPRAIPAPQGPHRVCSQPVVDGGGLLVNTHHLLHVLKAGIIGHHVIEGWLIVLHNAWELGERGERAVTRDPKKANTT